MSFGVNKDGFTRKRFADIKEEIVTELKQTFGEIDTSEDSVTGQIIGIMSKKYAEIWELAESVYNSFTVLADGVSLDNVASLTGIVRRSATFSEVNASLKGDIATVIPAGSKVEKTETLEKFSLSEDVTISDQILTKVIFGFEDFVSGTYSLGINFDGDNWSITGPATDIQSLITYFVDGFNSHYTNDEVVLIDNGDETFSVTSGDLVSPFSVTVSVPEVMVYSELWTPGIFIADVAGSTSVPSGTLVNIINNVSGWDEVNNFIDGLIGTEDESDDEFRVRRKEDLSVIGGGTVDAIRSRLLRDIENIIKVSVYENDTYVIDSEGRPPKSIHVVAEGGKDQDLIQGIWDVKGGGIETFGGTEGGASEVVGTAIDDEGKPHEVKFQRPDVIFASVRIVLTLNPEETFPATGNDEIRQNVADYGDKTFGTSADIIAQKFYGSVYSVPGILSATIEVGTSDTEGGTPTNWTDGHIPVSAFQNSDFDFSRVMVS